MRLQEKEHQLRFVVVPDGHGSLLGDKACENLGLVKQVYYINKPPSPHNSVESIINQNLLHIINTDVFKGFGVLPCTYKIQLKDDAKPVVHAPRSVPAPLCEKLKQELKEMTSLGVIKRIEEPTEWVNSMVCVRKQNGDLHVCMDPT